MYHEIPVFPSFKRKATRQPAQGSPFFIRSVESNDDHTLTVRACSQLASHKRDSAVTPAQSQPFTTSTQALSAADLTAASITACARAPSWKLGRQGRWLRMASMNSHA